MTDDPPPRPSPSPAPPPEPPAQPTRADRLEAKAQRLRDKQDAVRANAAKPAASPWLRIGLPIVAGVVVLGLTAALIWFVVSADQRGDDLDAARRDLAAERTLDAARASALQAAQTYAVDFGSYDYAHLDQDFRRVTAHLTPDFAKKYASVGSGLRSVIQQYHGKSTATVQGAGLASVTATAAVAVVFLDQTVTTTQSTTPRVDRNRMQMTLQRQRNGTWLISDLALK